MRFLFLFPIIFTCVINGVLASSLPILELSDTTTSISTCSKLIEEVHKIEFDTAAINKKLELKPSGEGKKIILDIARVSLRNEKDSIFIFNGELVIDTIVGTTSYYNKYYTSTESITIYPQLFPSYYSIIFDASVRCIDAEKHALPDFEVSANPIELDSVIRFEKIRNEDFEVVNSGVVPENSIKYEVYISEDDKIDENDNLIQSRTFHVNVTDPKQVTLNDVALDNSLEPGVYYFIISVDPENEFDEYDETNNIIVDSIRLLRAYTDHRIIKKTNFTSYRQGQEIKNEGVDIYNEGNSTIGISLDTDLKVYLSDDESLSDDDSLIYINKVFKEDLLKTKYYYQNISYTIPSNAKTGISYLIYVFDEENKLEEESTLNNVYAKEILITPFNINFHISDVVQGKEIAVQDVSPYMNFANIEYKISSINDYLQREVSVGYYISLDTIFNETEDVLVETDNLRFKGFEYITKEEVAIPEGFKGQDVYVLIVADNDQKYQEENLIDNVAYIKVKYVQLNVDLKSKLDVSTSGWTEAQIDMRVDIDASIEGYEQYEYIQDISYNYNIYFSVDTVISEDDLLIVDGAEDSFSEGRYTVTSTEYSVLPQNLETGNYYIIVSIDPSQSISDHSTRGELSYYKIPYYNDEDIIQYHPEEPGVDTIKSCLAWVGYTPKKLFVYPDVSDKTVVITSYPSVAYTRNYGLKIRNRSIAKGSNEFLEAGFFNKTNPSPGYSLEISCLDNSSKPDVELNYQKVTVTEDNTLYVYVMATYTGELQDTFQLASYISKDSILDGTDKLIFDKKAIMYEQSRGYSGSIDIIQNNFEGDYYVITVADRGEELPEKFEENNRLIKPVFIETKEQELPYNDYYIFNTKMSSRELVAGEGFKYEYSYSRNDGEITRVISKNNIYGGHDYYNVGLSQDKILDSLDNNRFFYFKNGYGKEYRTSIIDSYFPSGEYNFIACVNQNSIYDTVPENNCFSTEVTIKPSDIQLVLDSVEAVHSETAYGETFLYKVHYRNKGTTKANSFKIYTTESSDSSFNQKFNFVNGAETSIDANSSYVYPRENYTIYKNSKYLFVHLNPLKGVKEEDLSDNVFRIKINAQEPKVDLEICKESYIDNKTYNPNNTHSGFVCLRNNGTASSEIETTIKKYFSVDSILSSDDKLLEIEEVRPIERYSAQREDDREYFYNPNFISTSLPSGTYYIIYSLDEDSLIADVDRSNNIRVDPIKVAAFDVEFELLSVETPSDTLTEFEEYAFSVYFVDNGPGGNNSADPVVSVFLSRDAVFDSTDYLIQKEEINYSSPELKHTKVDFNGKLISKEEDGEHYLLFFIDFANSYYETDESNNFYAKKIHFVNKFVELELSNITGENEVKLGDSHYFQFDVSNLGNLTMEGTMWLDFYLSKDASLSEDDTLMSSSKLSNIYYYGRLRENETFKFGKSMQLYEGIEPGNYYVIAEIRSYYDKDESNNVTTFPISISYYDIDLKLKKLTVKENSVSTGFGSMLYFTMKLEENELYNQPRINVDFFLSEDDQLNDTVDFKLGIHGNYYLKDGEELNDSLFLYLPDYIEKGDYHLFMRLDYDNRIFDKDRSNNYSSVKVFIGDPETDLVFMAYKLDKNRYRADEKPRLSYTVTNQRATESRGFYVDCYLSNDQLFDDADSLIRDDYFYPLSFGEINSKNLNLHFLDEVNPGKYFLLLVIDEKDKILETEEDNNLIALPLELVDSSSNLKAKSIYIIDSKVSQGMAKSIYLDVDNTGSLPIDMYAVEYYLSEDNIISNDDKLLLTDSIKSSTEYSENRIESVVYFPAELNKGDYYLIAIIDRIDIIKEENEKDNIVGGSISVVGPGVDLSIRDSLNGVLKGYPNYESEVTTYVQNVGSFTAPENKVSYYLSNDEFLDNKDRLVSTETVDPLNPNVFSFEQEYVLMPDDADIGKQFMIVKVDSDDEIEELEEGNNITVLPINIVLPGPDFTNQKVQVNTTLVGPGVTISVTLHYSNIGMIKTAYNMVVAFYLSENETLDMNDQMIDRYPFDFPSFEFASNLRTTSSSGDSYTFSINLPDSILPNTKNLLVVLDADNEIEEEDEENNVISFPIEVINNDEVGMLSYISKSNSLYPNPTNGIVHFSSLDEKSEVRVLNEMGELISTTFTETNGVLDLGFLKNGVYILSIKNGEKLRREKLVILK